MQNIRFPKKFSDSLFGSRYKYFPSQRSGGGVMGFGASPAQPARAEPRPAGRNAGERRYDWGQGNVLGRQ